MVANVLDDITLNPEVVRTVIKIYPTKRPIGTCQVVRTLLYIVDPVLKNMAVFRVALGMDCTGIITPKACIVDFVILDLHVVVSRFCGLRGAPAYVDANVWNIPDFIVENLESDGIVRPYSSA
jgi:hypothetical protein